MTSPTTVILWLSLSVFCFATVSVQAQQNEAQTPNQDYSPNGTYLLLDSRMEHSDENKHTISIAQKQHLRAVYPLYSYPRLADSYFSPHETYLVISDYVGSGACECVLMQHTNKPPFYVKAYHVDDTCWKLFWSLHKKPKDGISYDHQSTYFCEWLDDDRFVVGLQGDKQQEGGKFYLEGGWHCIYDARKARAYTDKYTDSLNKSTKFELE